MGALLSHPGNRRARLRALLDAGTPVLAPGAYDALSARLVEQAGFDVAYMTGFGTTASLLGRPDVGLLGQAEMVGNARRMVAAVDVPLIADADTGYGNPINVVRTVREYEQAGVAGLHLEDQVMPKRCGHMAGKAVVPCDEMLAKIRAAAEARTDPDLVLIARTDVAAVEGVDAAIDRARRFADAGADVLFVEAPSSEADIERVATALSDHQLVFNWAEGGRTPPAAARPAHRARLRAGDLPRRDAARRRRRDPVDARPPAHRGHARGVRRRAGRPRRLRRPRRTGRGPRSRGALPDAVGHHGMARWAPDGGAVAIPCARSGFR